MSQSASPNAYPAIAVHTILEAVAKTLSAVLHRPEDFPPDMVREILLQAREDARAGVDMSHAQDEYYRALYDRFESRWKKLEGDRP